ncbi:von Willebrand factor type A domain protein [Azoarcus sp. Aa7]|nr:von Willebrand factor type A domain protein [Azoarcus sp. Aa7]
MASVSIEPHPLRMLAAAVAGSPVAVSYLTEPGARCWTDGERIYLSAERQAGEGGRELLVQCALLAGGALKAVGLRALIGSIEQRQCFLVLEVERCCASIAERLPRAFLNALEPYRTGQGPQDAEESLRIARSRTRLPKPPEWYGTLQPWAVLRRNVRGGGRSMDARKLEQLEARLGSLEAEQADGDEDALVRNPFWKLLSSPLGKDGFFARFMREIFDMQSSPDKAADSGIEGSSEMVSGRASRHALDLGKALRSGLAVAIPSALLVPEGGAHSYPEWDGSKGRYRPDWTSVEEVAPAADEPCFDETLLDAATDQPLLRSLASLCLGFRRHAGQTAGDDLVLDRLIRLAVDLRTGHSGDERIYSASLRTRRDLGVLILLDASSSTLEGGGNDRVVDRQVRAAWKLCRTFDRLGDRVALYGFHSWGRTLVRFQHLKAFDERLGAETRKRMGRLSVAGYTRSGAAIRHATELLDAHSGTPFKLLLLISDGYPYDDQYEGEYADQDTRKALEEARARGVACLCLSVGSDADVVRLERAWGSANYLAIGNATEMAARLRGAVERAIGAAARKRYVAAA